MTNGFLNALAETYNTRCTGILNISDLYARAMQAVVRSVSPLVALGYGSELFQIRARESYSFSSMKNV